MPQAIGENGNFPVGEVAEIAPAFIKITDFIAVSANKHCGGSDLTLLASRVIDLEHRAPDDIRRRLLAPDASPTSLPSIMESRSP